MRAECPQSVFSSASSRRSKNRKFSVCAGLRLFAANIDRARAAQYRAAQACAWRSSRESVEQRRRRRLVVFNGNRWTHQQDETRRSAMVFLFHQLKILRAAPES